MAAPPSSPEYQASRTALACWLIQLTASALPFISTTTSGLPACGNGFDQRFFRLGQVDAGAVAAEEARLIHRHLFAFKLAGDADDGDDDISIFRSGQRFR